MTCTYTYIYIYINDLPINNYKSKRTHIQEGIVIATLDHGVICKPALIHEPSKDVGSLGVTFASLLASHFPNLRIYPMQTHFPKHVRILAVFLELTHRYWMPCDI